ncbi:MAG: Delta3-Delta2-enoyl-CoA isomerase [Actinomycetota bacterium]|nr:putative enoyl-CoA hydratase/isomerase family protein [Cryptosporangiaceae bacterium]MDQ1677049.1 Delta3-Delta2-enoyl-CoA isomerase [Actinomycetota bacterium]
MPTLDRDGDVRILDLGSDENRFSPGWLAAVGDALAEVATADGPRALVTKATGKFWSNGLDLDWLGAHGDQLASYVDSIHAVFAQLLVLPVPTVAAVQGHCFAGGAMLALAHDWRYMRADRGFLCLPEVDIHIPFTPGMSGLIQSKLTPATATDAMTTGRRYGGAEAAAAGIVTEAVDEEKVFARAVEHAAALTGKAGPTLGTIKERMYAGPVAALAAGLG